MKNYIAIIAWSLPLLFFVLPQSALAFQGGDGSSGNPYQIENCSDLQSMNNDLAASYSIVNNIDCSNTTSWNSGAGFVPVGYDASHPFIGTLEGNYHIITGLYINSSARGYAGLFGVAGDLEGDFATIDNLGLVNENITSSGYVGGLIGYVQQASGLVLNDVYTTGSVSATSSRSYVGGLLGDNESGNSLSKIYTTANVSAAGDNSYAGGLVGYLDDEIDGSYARGNVLATGNNSSAGGFAGYSYNGDSYYSYATGNITASGVGSHAGGWVGYSSNGDVYYAFATGNVTGTNAGGFYGYDGHNPVDCWYYNNQSDHPIGVTKAANTAYFQNNIGNDPLSHWDFVAAPIYDVTNTYPSLHWQMPVIYSVASSTAFATATVTWTTDKASNSTVWYGTISGIYTTSTSSMSSVTSHSIGLTNLSSSTLYYYIVVSANSSGDSATSSEATLLTMTPLTAVTDVATLISQTGAALNGHISYTGSVNAAARGFRWGTSAIYGATTTESGSFGVSSFVAALSSLTCGTTYDFQAYATSTAGISYGNDQTLTTLACSVASSQNTQPAPSMSSGGGTVSIQALAAILAPSPAATAYLNSLKVKASPIASSTGSIFGRSLTIGSNGLDVKQLQIYLNTHGFSVARSGAGSIGYETNIFGLLTRAALAHLQKANGISPAVGFFGPVTRQFVGNNP